MAIPHSPDCQSYVMFSALHFLCCDESSLREEGFPLAQGWKGMEYAVAVAGNACQWLHEAADFTVCTVSKWGEAEA